MAYLQQRTRAASAGTEATGHKPTDWGVSMDDVFSWLDLQPVQPMVRFRGAVSGFSAGVRLRWTTSYS